MTTKTGDKIRVLRGDGLFIAAGDIGEVVDTPEWAKRWKSARESVWAMIRGKGEFCVGCTQSEGSDYEVVARKL